MMEMGRFISFRTVRDLVAIEIERNKQRKLRGDLPSSWRSAG